MDENINSKQHYQTPFRSKENYNQDMCTTIDRSSFSTAFEEKRNFHTPKKNFSDRHNDIINEAPKKNFTFESKTSIENEPLKTKLFKDDDLSTGEEKVGIDYYKIQKINGALTYYKIDNFFVLQGFLEWMVTFDDIKEILYDIVKSFIQGFNGKSILINQFFVINH